MAGRSPLPKHPFRDSAIFYGVLAGVVVAVGIFTYGDTVQILVVAALFFVVATAYSWWRFRQRLAEQAQRGP